MFPAASCPTLYSTFYDCMLQYLAYAVGLDCLGKHTSIVGPIVAQDLRLSLSRVYASLSSYIQ